MDPERLAFFATDGREPLDLPGTRCGSLEELVEHVANGSDRLTRTKGAGEH